MLKVTYGFLKKFLDNPEYYGAIPTGSRQFKVENINGISDYDYIITTKNWNNINADIELIYFDSDYEGNLFQSVHFLYNEKNYNILVMDNIEFRCWKFATDIITEIIKNIVFKEIIKNKEKRVELFEYFKNNCRRILPRANLNIKENKK